MDEEKRKKKWGRWGQNKYVYPDKKADALREFLTERIFETFPGAKIEYFT
jgi:spore photoproduct lyase